MAAPVPTAGAATASPHVSSVVAAAASGTSVGSVFIKHAGNARAHFARVPILVGDAVTDLAERASLERGWNVDAAYVELFLVPVDMVREVQVDLACEAGVLVDANRCLATDMLAEAGIRDRSCLLARLTDSPAAVPGKCAREPVSLLSCSSSWRPEGLTGCAWVPSHAPITPPPVPCRCARCCCCWRWRGPGGVALTG